MRINSTGKVAGLALAGGAALLLVRALRGGSTDVGPEDEADEAATYPPLDTPKPVADNVWIVDSGPMRPGGIPMPVRMTVVRLADGALLLHSPTQVSDALVAALEVLGQVRHLVAPNVAHWSYLEGWQARFPDAVTWGAPGLRGRRQVRAAKVRIDRDLSGEAPEAWREEIAQGLIRSAGYAEVYLFHRPSRTLILTDLVQHLRSRSLPAVTRAFSRLAGTQAGTTPRYLRVILYLRHADVVAALRAMLALAPERVIFAHGAWFAQDGTARLRQALAWVIA
ncbi:DUF4336 domain-containing protein [uncultured Sphingomonas sp.]|uniref:DUF4336 domain-containing protein n=1 Tax=uncultured Sphingomonas sp. TaxID=158754 RepID=UPI00261748BC|nr:DUF4336 domain-containing protein [uncultured Sphingomonas sp.]